MRLLTAVAGGLVLLAQPAISQTYPSKPIHILVPYAPGGIADIAARIVGAKLTEAWGQQVVVENRPGGNGFIAMTAGAKAAPDGYTLTMATVGDVSINPALFKDMPYNVERDFAPIGAVSDAPMVLAANANSPYKTVADVIAAAKEQPGRISVGSPGNGSINQIVLEWMALNTGTEVPAHPLQGRRAGGGRGRGRRHSARRDGELVGCAAHQVRAGARAGHHRRQALEVQSRMADLAVAGREGRRCVELDPAARAQGHAEGDHRQAQRRGGEDPQHARREGALRRRRRRNHPVDAGRARRKVKKTARALLVIVEKAKIKPD